MRTLEQISRWSLRKPFSIRSWSQNDRIVPTLSMAEITDVIGTKKRDSLEEIVLSFSKYFQMQKWSPEMNWRSEFCSKKSLLWNPQVGRSGFVAWLEEWLLLTPDDPGSNPVIGYFDGMAVTMDQTWGSSNEVSLKRPIGYFPHTHRTYFKYLTIEQTL